MASERTGAIASGAGGIGLGGTMFAANYFSFIIPPPLVAVAGLVSVCLLFLSGALWSHIGWRWARARGAKMAPLVGMAIGGVIVIGCLIWAVLTYSPPQAAATQTKDAETSPYSDLRNLTNQQLRGRIFDLTKRMRAFEAGYSQQRFSPFSRRPQPKTKEEALAEWQKQNAESDQVRAKYQAEFQARYRPEALALREEAANRLGIFPPYPDPEMRHYAIDRGSLAGSSAIYWACDYLDELARKLP